MIAYEVSKAAMNRMTVSVAASNAKHGVRCNAMAPLGGRMGDGWDTAHAALFLASDGAKFITGVLLRVDGGMSTRVG